MKIGKQSVAADQLRLDAHAKGKMMMGGGTNGRARELRFSKQNLSKSVKKIKILRVEKLWSFRLKTKESTETS